MPTPPLTDEEAQAAVDLLAQYGSQVKAADKAGLSRSAFQARLKRAAQRGMMLDAPAAMPGYVIKKVSTTTDQDGELKSESIQQVQEPGEKYELAKGQIVKGISTLVDAEGRVTQQWVKTKLDNVVPDLILALKAAFGEYEGKSEPVAAPKVADLDLLCVYPIADQHVGLLSWGLETGEDYDLKIGAQRLRESMAQLVAQSRPAAEALILNLGDWQHTDDQKNATPGHGHQLDVDSRYFKILQAGVQLMVDCIELAKHKHRKVMVRNLPGNHDPHASIALTIALDAYYRNDPRVTIDCDPSDHFFLRFGATLIGATHGHKMKPERMAMMMAVNQREDWGATLYHWMLYGHIHHESVKEVGDVRCESFQTLIAKDAYAAGHGYMAGQSLQCVTLHRQDGEAGRHRVNIPPPQPRRRAA